MCEPRPDSSPPCSARKAVSRLAPARPEPDLLSTFTASIALAGLGALSRVKLAPIARFAHALQAPAGGFRACAGDAAPDVEYTYYGIGTLALLALAAGRGT